MRQWMVKPELLCNRHLLGEHVEHHMFVGTIRKGNSLTGYVRNGLVEPDTLFHRHNFIVDEMQKRGMNHKTPISQEDKEMLDKYILENPTVLCIDVKHNLEDLKTRCPECRKRIEAVGL